MANVSKLILAAAIMVATITTPALAAHEGKPISAPHYGYGVYNFVPVAPSVYGSGRLVREARSGDLWDGGGP